MDLVKTYHLNETQIYTFKRWRELCLFKVLT
jgi:hypothetical protein